MATNISKLKSTKGAPPVADMSQDVIATNTRADEKAPTRPLQVRVPETIFAEFSEQAGKEFGFSHGAKKQLFLKIWDAYKAQSMKA